MKELCGLYLRFVKKRAYIISIVKQQGNSVVPKLAEELAVPYLENNLFFDHLYTEQHICKQALKVVDELIGERTINCDWSCWNNR